MCQKIQGFIYFNLFYLLSLFHYPFKICIFFNKDNNNITKKNYTKSKSNTNISFFLIKIKIQIRIENC